MIEERRLAPRDDLISGLLDAQIEGQRLTLPELLGFCSLLLVAGNETTTNLIGNALLCFVDRPEVWARLRAAPALLPQAIEEVLRYRSPVQSMFRVTTAQVSIRDQVIPAGASVVAWIGSANHDEAQFPDPEQFDVERQPNRHIAFGYGIHYCLGAPLARLEAKIALTAMLERWGDIRRSPDVALEALPSTIVYGVRSLPISFERAGAAG
jgi:cytochrome P450